MVITGLDPHWPSALTLLLGPDAAPMLEAAVSAHGAHLRTLRATSVGVQPTGSAVVQYEACVARRDGSVTREFLVAATGHRIPPGAALLAGHGTVVGVWRRSWDPALPALAAVTDPHRLTETLRAAGLSRSAPPTFRVRAYRPGRRAVVEIDGGGPVVYAKIVRPAAAAAVRARHDLLDEHVPVPRLLAATDDGLLLMPQAPGTPVRTLLGRGEAPPSAAELSALLDGLPDGLLAFPRTHGHLARVRHFCTILTLTAATDGPDRERIEELATALGSVDADGHPVVPVHGDFYEGQLLATNGRVSGLLDVDTAGRGHRIDEWATLLAHLSVLALHLPRPEPLRRYGAAVLAAAETAHPREQLRPRVAAAVLGLATGPFRVQQHGWREHTRARIGLAARWLSGDATTERA